MTTHQDYALFVNQVSKLTERRQAVTITYLPTNATIVGVLDFILNDASMINGAKNTARY